MLIVVTLWLPGQAGECQKVDPGKIKAVGALALRVQAQVLDLGVAPPKKTLKVNYTVRMKSESDQIMTCLGLCCMYFLI